MKRSIRVVPHARSSIRDGCYGILQRYPYLTIHQGRNEPNRGSNRFFACILVQNFVEIKASLELKRNMVWCTGQSTEGKIAVRDMLSLELFLTKNVIQYWGDSHHFYVKRREPLSDEEKAVTVCESQLKRDCWSQINPFLSFFRPTGLMKPFDAWCNTSRVRSTLYVMST